MEKGEKRFSGQGKGRAAAERGVPSYRRKKERVSGAKENIVYCEGRGDSVGSSAEHESKRHGESVITPKGSP